MSEIPKAYEPGKIEEKWYDFWLKQGYFTPKIDPEKKPFVIIMPPPNVTGELHLGHALTDTLEDIMVRWHRMKGEPVLWLPGSDHAGIATQVVVEQQLAKQGQTKNDIGRENFAKLAWEWADKSRKNIRHQHQMLGASCDWTRECFTLDEGPSRAVRTAFVRLYQKGLIYRDERMINWCPRCQTALSDLEVEHKDTTGYLYYIRYPLANDKAFVTVATTRPETFFGDTAVAVNPQDKRYKDLVGKSVVLPIIDREIPIIADEAVDPAFGTGALKITPAHDPTDFAVAERHNLPLLNIMNPDATMNENVEAYKGLERFTCREKVVADLRDKGLLEKIEPYFHSVGYCNRCQTMIEPRVSLQWFIRIQPLAKAAIEAVKEGKITIIPERFTKIYFDWMENIKDWCISRQLWWGHRIPVWYCQDCGKVTTSVNEPSACAYCSSKQIIQDPDVLDTWFSSALWTHSTLGWPDDTDDLRYFYPTSVMETGYDILFFWVARMVMMGLEDTGKIPFYTVYLHGLIRDESGEKMSKLRGNVINPIQAINEYGVDALRFALIMGSSPGNDLNLGEGRLKSSRNFINKLWNTARFIFQSMDTTKVASPELDSGYQEGAGNIEDRWVDSQLNRLIQDTSKLMEDFEFGEAAQQIYDFIWSKFCDWYIEIAKIRLRGDQSTPSPLPLLVNTLEKSLCLLHPFMPFITEELWQNLNRHCARSEAISPRNEGIGVPDSIAIVPYPVADDKAINPEAERVMDCVMDIVRSIRNARAQYKVKVDKWIEAEIYTDELLSCLIEQKKIIEKLARAQPLAILSRQERKFKAPSPLTGEGREERSPSLPPTLSGEGQLGRGPSPLSPLSGKGREGALILVVKEAEVVLPWAGMVDLKAEREKLAKESEITQAKIEKIEIRLRDDAFLAKAPPHILEKERQKLDTLKDKLMRLHQELSQLTSPSERNTKY